MSCFKFPVCVGYLKLLNSHTVSQYFIEVKTRLRVIGQHDHRASVTLGRPNHQAVEGNVPP